MKHLWPLVSLVVVPVCLLAATAGSIPEPVQKSANNDSSPAMDNPILALHPADTDKALVELRQTREELKLSREQDQLWQDADRASREAIENNREGRRRLSQIMASEMSKNILDLDRIARESDSVAMEAFRQRTAARDKWLLLYHALSNEQKMLAGHRIRDRFERARVLRERALLPHP